MPVVAGSHLWYKIECRLTRTGHEHNVCVRVPVTAPLLQHHPIPSTLSGSFAFFKSLLVAIAMSIARDDIGNIREMHAAADGLPHNFRDASGGTDGKQVYVDSFGNQLTHV